MDAIFVELSIFEAKRADYLSDDEFKTFQQILLINPFCGDVIQHTGGLRKVRFADHRRGKGKRGGLKSLTFYFLSFTIKTKKMTLAVTSARCCVRCWKF
jgi:hypothetical protein